MFGMTELSDGASSFIKEQESAATPIHSTHLCLSVDLWLFNNPLRAIRGKKLPQLFRHQLLHELWIGFAARLAHGLADEEAKQARLAAPVGIDLVRELGEQTIHDSAQCIGVGDLR